MTNQRRDYRGVIQDAMVLAFLVFCVYACCGGLK